jgi:hypothetical protein
LPPKARPWTPSSTAIFFAVWGIRLLREGIRRKLPELWRVGNWLLHDDYALSHQALVTREFLAHNSITTLPHPPYSPYLVPCDFFLFPKRKMQLKGHRFVRVEESSRNHRLFLVRFENDFQHAFEQWKRRWDRCDAAQGDYFEGMLP